MQGLRTLSVVALAAGTRRGSCRLLRLRNRRRMQVPERDDDVADAASLAFSVPPFAPAPSPAG